MEFLKILQNYRSPLFDSIFLLLTKFGEETILILIICTLYWCINKDLAYRLSFCFFGTGLSVQVLKITFRIPRPFILDPSIKPVQKAVRTATGYSFPSGHTQGATAVYTTTAVHAKKLSHRIVYGLLILCVMFSRMYLGVHTPADVFTSFFLTFSLSILINQGITKLDLLNTHLKETGLLLLLLSAAAAIYSIYLLNHGYITTAYATDCCKAAGAGIGFAVGWYTESLYIKFNPTTVKTWIQPIKLLIGIATVLVLKTGLKALLGPSILANFIRYSILVFFITGIYPFFIKKFIKTSIN